MGKKQLISGIVMSLAMTMTHAQNAPVAKTKAQAPPAKPATTSSSKPAQSTAGAAKAMPLPNSVAGVKDSYDTWVKPLYPTAKGTEKTITQVEHFPYHEMKFEPPAKVDPVSKDQYSFVSPEDAFTARMSSMMNLDYDGWLGSWDKKAQQYLNAMAEHPEFSKESRMKQWKNILSAARPTMVRKITSGEYTIISYKLITAQGKELQPFELPATFHQVGGLWYGTEDLRTDPLLAYMPWSSGKSQEEVDVRPLSQSVIPAKGAQ